jgi:hypothetical protein
LHILVEGFRVFGVQVQYWMPIAALIVAAFVAFAAWTNRPHFQTGHYEIRIRPLRVETGQYLLIREPGLWAAITLLRPSSAPLWGRQ